LSGYGDDPVRHSKLAPAPGPGQPGGPALGNVSRVADALPGRPSPLGATPRDGGTNFAVASSVAEAAEVCLISDSGEETRFRLPDYDDGVWHGFVPGAGHNGVNGINGIKGAAQAYGFRVRGPYDAARGLRCNPAKLLLDPYARAVWGEVSFGPEVFDYSWDDHDAPSSLDSAGRSTHSTRRPWRSRTRRCGGPVTALWSGLVRSWCCAGLGFRDEASRGGSTALPRCEAGGAGHAIPVGQLHEGHEPLHVVDV